MKEPIDPHTALTALNHTLQEAAKEFEFDVEVGAGLAHAYQLSLLQMQF